MRHLKEKEENEAVSKERSKRSGKHGVPETDAEGFCWPLPDIGISGDSSVAEPRFDR